MILFVSFLSPFFSFLFFLFDTTVCRIEDEKTRMQRLRTHNQTT